MSDIGIRNYDDLFLHRDFKLKDLKSISDIQHDLNYINLNDNNSPNSPNSHSWVDILIGKKSNKSLDDNILLSPTSDRLRGAFRGIDKKLTFDEYNKKSNKTISLQNQLKLVLITQRVFRKWQNENLVNSNIQNDNILEEQNKISLIIQSLWRGAKLRQEFLLKKKLVISLQKIAKARLDLRATQQDNNQIAINKKTDLNLKEKLIQISLSGVSSFVGAVLVFEGWLQLLNTLGLAGAGLAISNPLQIIPLALAGAVTGVSYFVNYWLYKAKIGDCFVKRDINNIQNQNQNQNQNQKDSIFQKSLKGLMLLSISIYTFSFFLASLQSEYLFGNFCKNFMDNAALKGDSFLQLLTTTPVGLAISSVFLICAVLSAGCQFYFAASSIIKQSPGESLSKIKSYFSKMFGYGGDKNRYKISDEDLHSKLNYQIYNLKYKNKQTENEVNDFRNTYSSLSLSQKMRFLVILKKLQSGEVINIDDLSSDSILQKLSDMKNKSKFQSILESSTKLISASIFVAATASLLVYLGPLVLAMFPALMAIKVALAVSCGSIFLARVPVGLESSFWAAERFSHIMCNMNEVAFKWKYNKGKYLPGSYGMLYEKLSLNFLNAVANMAFAFFGAASGGMTYIFGASLFFLSFVITVKPCFEKKNLNVLGGVIQSLEKKNVENDQNIQTSFWGRFKERLFSKNNNELVNDNASQEPVPSLDAEAGADSDSNLDLSNSQLAA